MYSAKFKIEVPKLMKRFWGDNFYSAGEKKWGTSKADGYARGFNQFVLDPIFKVIRARILRKIVKQILIYLFLYRFLAQ